MKPCLARSTLPGWVLGLSVALSGCAGLNRTGSPSAAPPADPAAEAGTEPQLAPLTLPEGWQSPVPWERAAPAAHLDKGAWWEAFGDTTLNTLQAQAQRHSPTLVVAAARLRQAHAAAQVADAAALPRLDGSARVTRQKTSANRPSATSSGQATSTVQNDSVLGLALSYEVDWFGRIGLEREVAAASVAQAQADLAQARLLLAADVANAWFSLQQIDAETQVLTQSIEWQERALALLRSRQQGGLGAGLEVAQQQAQLEATRTQLALLQRQRPLVVHALATLSAQPATALNLPVTPLPSGSAPALAVPASLPSQLLQRRPDIASAQQAVAAANAQLGVARAAAWPSLVLGANGGLESRDWGLLLSGPSLLWSLGATLTQSLLDGGRQSAREAGALAAQEAASATYRQTVLRAVQEAEDALSSLATLETAARSAQAAIDASAQALRLTQVRHAGGLVSYLEVTSAQQAWLNNLRQATQIDGQRRLAGVALVRALGGGWRVGVSSGRS